MNRYKHFFSLVRGLRAYIWRMNWFQYLVIKVFSIGHSAIPFTILDRMNLFLAYQDNPIQAHRFMRGVNSRNPKNIKMLDFNLLKRAVEFNYLSWPRKIFAYVRDKDLLDVGCGTGLHAIGYVVAGVNSYTGLDPKIDFSSDRGKNIRNRQWEQFGWTPSDIMRQLPHVRFIPGTFEEIAPQVTFDIVVLHNVTEHLHNLEEVFKGIVKRIRPDGKILYNHHNFFCWNGHHKMPKSIMDINLDDPIQRKYIDWGHVAFAESHTDELSEKLNKIRMDDLKQLTEKYFLIETWKEIPSNAEQGHIRFTNAIIRKYPKYEKREFMIQNIFCVAEVK
jgi:2-polyprenyl-3-methyl-5-hydroxy-6-metoxy-1,4-benzoquinol methylase